MVLVLKNNSKILTMIAYTVFEVSPVNDANYEQVLLGRFFERREDRKSTNTSLQKLKNLYLDSLFLCFVSAVVSQNLHNY